MVRTLEEYERKSHGDVLVNRILEESEIVRFPFNRLSLLERERRVQKMADTVIGSCVDRRKIKEEGLNHLIGNMDLEIDVLTLLDGIKNRIQYELKMNLETVNNDNVTPPPP